MSLRKKAGNLMRTEMLIGDNITTEGKFVSKLTLSILPDDILNFWERGSNLANSIAHYHLNISGISSSADKFSSILNELIENAVKFSSAGSNPVNLSTKSNPHCFCMQITNPLSNKDRDQLIKQIRNLFSQDTKSLYKSRLEELSNNSDSPGIGLILLKKDSNLRLNFKFMDSGDHSDVTVTAELLF